MALQWTKPEEVRGMGLVYVSKCRQFMIVREGSLKYKLSYLTTTRHEKSHVGEFEQLHDAKDAAEDRKALFG